jgi:glycosyltransferase involved in cell wall biosynthesis
MRIAINAWFHSQPATGSGQYVRQLTAALKDIDASIDLRLVTPKHTGNLAKVWFEQVEFPRAASAMGADIAFVPYWAPPLQSAVPVVVTIHDVIPLALPEYRGGLRQRLYTALVHAGSPGAAHILTDSEFSKADILKYLGINSNQLSAVPLAADRRFSPTIHADDIERAQLRYDLPETYVLYLGGFDQRKNIETLLQIYVWASATIGEEFPLVITGDADTTVLSATGRRMTLGRMCHELELGEDVVRFIGRAAEEDKAALYAGARCFLFTSLYEGFGLPALEAMSCGTPVIGSNAASLPEVVGNAGMLMEPNDARLMAGALIAVCTEDDLYKRLRQAALMRSGLFSWQRTAMETLAVFKRILSK